MLSHCRVHKQLFVALLVQCLVSVALQAIPEKPLVVVIPSRNNSQWCIRNLESIFKQEYSNYRIVFYDDDSDDGQYELVQECCKKHGQQYRVKIIRNSERCGALANHYAAVHSCRDDEIIVHVDGDDWLKHPQVFSRINQVYSDPEVWMTYGQFEEYPRGSVGQCKPMPAGIVANNLYREYDWVSSHLRTFYAGLFKRIKLQDLVYKGSFFKTSLDMAFMFSMLEMAGDHCRNISEVLYVYNQATPNNDFKKHLVEQLHNDKVIRSRKKYARLQVLEGANPGCIADVVIISDNRPAHLYALLETMHRYCSGLGELHVLYTADDQATAAAYSAVQQAFEHVAWVRIEHLCSDMQHALEQCSHNYVFLASDGVIIKDFIFAGECIKALEKTQAHAFHMCLGKNITKNSFLSRTQRIPSTVRIDEDICAWRYAEGEYAWHTPYDVCMSLYRTGDLADALVAVGSCSLENVVAVLNTANLDELSMGLCFDASKAVLIATAPTYTPLFNEGFKIDTVPFFRIDNEWVRTCSALETIRR